jgi:hypothetical protein
MFLHFRIHLLVPLLFNNLYFDGVAFLRINFTESAENSCCADRAIATLHGYRLIIRKCTSPRIKPSAIKAAGDHALAASKYCSSDRLGPGRHRCTDAYGSAERVPRPSTRWPNPYIVYTTSRMPIPAAINFPSRHSRCLLLISTAGSRLPICRRRCHLLPPTALPLHQELGDSDFLPHAPDSGWCRPSRMVPFSPETQNSASGNVP